jgi:glycogen(starch) synthase
VRVTLLSLSDIGRDWRVRRHAQLLQDLGHDVSTVGLRSEVAALPWPTSDVELPGWTTREKAEQALLLASVRLRPSSAGSVYWSSPRYQALYAAAVATGKADLYVANDWNTLPAAARLAKETGGRFAYDTHEYAVEEGADRRRWRLVWPPFLRALEGDLLRDAVWVSTVSDGIADLLQADHHLAVRPTVIRNVPAYQAMPYREPGNVLTVLFHGGLLRDRGLEPLLESVAAWSPDRRLVVRGNGQESYLEQLRSIVERTGTVDRVTFEPAVPHPEVVSTANATADIGIHPMPALTNQTRFALPNKFFEYTMAGLVVCVVGGSEMARLVTEQRNGVLLASSRSEAIAEAVNGLDRATVSDLKRASLAAAKDLSWESEQSRLTGLYEHV